jgi:serpin B
LPAVPFGATIASRKPGRRNEAVKTKILLALSLLIVGVAARANTSPVTAIADANNRFCLDLYRQMQGTPGNLAFSPYSISSALAMTYAGARGRTEEEMARVLHLLFGQDSTHAAAAALRKALLASSSAAGCTLSVANRLWGQDGFQYLEPFLKTTRDAYGAELGRLDFVHKSEDSRRRINDWTLEQTRGKIPDLLPENLSLDQVLLVLSNAIYFKGTWRKKFHNGSTHDAAFYPVSTETLQVPTMHKRGHYQYAHVDGVRALIMDYEGERQSMAILLPDESDGLDHLESNLSTGNLTSWLAATQNCDVDLWLPRFRAASTVSLRDVLVGLGMTSAFSSSADFSGIDGRDDLHLSVVIHKTAVDVMEEGTQAAAASNAGIKYKGTSDGFSVGDVPIPLRVDHPFIFLIRDNGTGCILFIGQVTNPLL